MPDQNAMPDQTAPGTARPAATRAGLAGPLSAVLFTAAGAAGFVLETTARSAGFDDGDNPAQSVALFAVNPTPYSLSGLTLAVAAVALLMLVLAVHESVLAAVRPLYARFVTGIGLISAVLLFLGGVIRLQAPGTVTHIAGLDREWGLAAYLAVQMSGTQGALSAAIFAFALWAVGVCVAAARPHTLPLPVLLVGLLPALVLVIPLIALAGRVIGQDTSDVLYPIYLIAIFVGIPLFSLAVGWVLWRRRRAT
jgi:hypothetical protein